MICKITIMLSLFVCSECVYVYSSFWAPVFEPRVLGYKVEAPFDANSARNARDTYTRRYGHRGVHLIALLGSGRGPSEHTATDDMYGGVKFYYTYPAGRYQ